MSGIECAYAEFVRCLVDMENRRIVQSFQKKIGDKSIAVKSAHKLAMCFWKLAHL